MRRFDMKDRLKRGRNLMDTIREYEQEVRNLFFDSVGIKLKEFPTVERKMMEYLYHGEGSVEDMFDEINELELDDEYDGDGEVEEDNYYEFVLYTLGQ